MVTACTSAPTPKPASTAHVTLDTNSWMIARVVKVNNRLHTYYMYTGLSVGTSNFYYQLISQLTTKDYQIK